MADDTKTAEALSAETQALTKVAEQPGSRTDKPASTGDSAAVVAGRTRRGVLKWITPVILFLGTAAKVGTAQAASTDDFVPTEPPRTGRCIPPPAAARAAGPTASPALQPTPAPALQPTPAPALQPTASPALQPTPALEPTPAPALEPTSKR